VAIGKGKSDCVRVPCGQGEAHDEGPVVTRVRRTLAGPHDAPDLLRRLDDNGLVTGAQVVVAADGSSEDALTVDIGDRTMALGVSTARLIWVEPER
jgi:Fe2+ transport system protein FeoA